MSFANQFMAHLNLVEAHKRGETLPNTVIDLPEEWEHYTQWNEHLSAKWKDLDYNIIEKKDPLPDYEEWKEREKNEELILDWEEG